MDKINRSTGNLLTCIIEVIIGVLLLIDPIGFSTGILFVLGIVLLVMGVVSLVRYFRAEPEEAAKESGLAAGILFVLLGLFLMLRSEWILVTFPLFTAFYGILTLLSGISKIQWAVDMLRMKQKYWYVAVIGAVLTLVFAVLILANPFASTATLWTFTAVVLIIEAVVDVVTFIMEKVSARKVSKE